MTSLPNVITNYLCHAIGNNYQKLNGYLFDISMVEEHDRCWDGCNSARSRVGFTMTSSTMIQNNGYVILSLSHY